MDRDEYAAVPLPEAEFMFHRDPAEGRVYVMVKWPANERAGTHFGFKFPMSDELLLDRVMRGTADRETDPTVAEARGGPRSMRTLSTFRVASCSGCPFRGSFVGDEPACNVNDRSLQDLHHDADRPGWCPLDEHERMVKLAEPGTNATVAEADAATAEDAARWTRIVGLIGTCKEQAEHEARAGYASAERCMREVAKKLTAIVSFEPTTPTMEEASQMVRDLATVERALNPNPGRAGEAWGRIRDHVLGRQP